MTQPRLHQPQLCDAQDAQIGQYQALSVQAVLGLLLGLLGATALIEPTAWVVPLAGVLLSSLALRQIARNSPALGGRKLAVAGLVLSVLFATAAPADWFLYRWLVRREAQHFADCWFQFLRNDEPHKAYQLLVPPNHRQPLDASLWDYYRKNSDPCEELVAYVSLPLVKTLLALGPKAQARCYQIQSQQCLADCDDLDPVYRVTCEEAGQCKTFFVRLHLQRLKFSGVGLGRWQLGRAAWQLLIAEEHIQPAGTPEADQK